MYPLWIRPYVPPLDTSLVGGMKGKEYMERLRFRIDNTEAMQN